MSTESTWWTAGFLAGNEPDGHALFGDTWDEVEADEASRVEEWRQAAAEFRRTGVWAPGTTE